MGVDGPSPVAGMMGSSCCCQRRCSRLDHLDDSYMSKVIGYERERRGGPPTDDGQGVALRLLRGGGVLTPHRPASPRGHRLQGVGGERTPDFRTISDFRKDNLDALSGRSYKALCQHLGHVALGSRPASKHKMSYQLALAAEVAELLPPAADDEEDTAKTSVEDPGVGERV